MARRDGLSHGQAQAETYMIGLRQPLEWAQRSLPQLWLDSGAVVCN